MFTVMRRELLSYFVSPIGYIFLAMFYLLSGIFFYSTTLQYGYGSLNQVFDALFTVLLFIIPILTMRLLSEERRNKTDQALLTAPVSLTGMVLGKYLSAVIVYLIALSITLVYGAVIAFFTYPEWAVIWGNFIGMLLMGMALIAIGLFISSLTENQFIAALLSFGLSFLLFMVDSFQSMLSGPVWTVIIGAVSFYTRYSSFVLGMLDLVSVVFYLSVSTLFIFLTVRVFEKRRWS